jgi:hypothetical protein
MTAGAAAQKPFTEGVLVYKVTLTTPDNAAYKGTYVFSFKGAEIKKELLLDNGFKDVTLYNCATNKIYTLQRGNEKQYAIQLSMDDLLLKQQKFTGFRIRNEEKDVKELAGYKVYKGTVVYRNGSQTDIFYTKEWKPVQSITYNRFPGAQFFPLYFAYSEENGTAMTFEAEKMEAVPVASSVFEIPKDFIMISYEEYKQLRNE